MALAGPMIPLPIDRIRGICRRYDVRELSVFGSAVRDDFDQRRSDVDLLVEFNPDTEIGLIEYSRMQRELAEVIGRPVDLVTKKGLKPFIRDDVLSEAEVIHSGGSEHA